MFHFSHRLVTPADSGLIRRFAVLAAFPPSEPAPAWDAGHPRVELWSAGWGRDGDIGVLLVDDAGDPAGLGWARVHDEPLLHDPASGAPLAELAIAVSADRRGSGLGSQLLEALCDAAAAAGHPALSLYAEPPRVAWYERSGFARVTPRDSGWIMSRSLTEASPGGS